MALTNSERNRLSARKRYLEALKAQAEERLRVLKNNISGTEGAVRREIQAAIRTEENHIPDLASQIKDIDRDLK